MTPSGPRGIDFILGENYLDHLDGGYDLPHSGMYFYNEALQKARKEGKVVTS